MFLTILDCCCAVATALGRSRVIGSVRERWFRSIQRGGCPVVSGYWSERKWQRFSVRTSRTASHIVAPCQEEVNEPRYLQRGSSSSVRDPNRMGSLGRSLRGTSSAHVNININTHEKQPHLEKVRALVTCNRHQRRPGWNSHSCRRPVVVAAVAPAVLPQPQLCWP